MATSRIGCQRGDPRRLDGRSDAGDERCPDSDDDAGDDRPGADHEVGGGQFEAGLHHRLEEAGDSDAGDEADGRRQHTNGERFGGNREHDLPARCADGAHQGRLAGALGDEDRERVVDAEGGNDDGDTGEGQQQCLEEAEEVTLDVALLLGGELGAGERLDPVGERRRDPRFELRGGNGRPRLARARL